MTYLEIGLLILGLGLLVFGYRKNSRNALVVAALVLLASGAIPDFISGVHDGFNGAGPQASAG